MRSGAQARPEINFYDHEAILGSKRCPVATRLSKTPFQIPVTFSYQYQLRGEMRHKELVTYVKHDWMPFGFTNPSQPTAQVFFPGVEFDPHTERLASEDDTAPLPLGKKLQAILDAGWRRWICGALRHPQRLHSMGDDQQDAHAQLDANGR